MIVGGYTLDLYCDCCPKEKNDAWSTNPPHQYAAINLKMCMKWARKDGWSFRKKMCRCPKCGQEGKSFPKEIEK